MNNNLKCEVRSAKFGLPCLVSTLQGVSLYLSTLKRVHPTFEVQGSKFSRSHPSPLTPQPLKC